MAVSAETKAIIDTLKAEGQAMRDEANPASLAALNLKFDRFEKVLSTISDQIGKQTDAVVDEAASAKDAREKAALKAELDQLQNEKKAETEKKEKVNLANEIKTAIPNMLKGLQRTLTNFLIGGIGALALGGFVTGIVDSFTDGGFSKFVGDFIGGDWETIRDNLNSGGYNFSEGVTKMLDFALKFAPGGDYYKAITAFTDGLGNAVDWFKENPFAGVAAATLLLSSTARRLTMRMGKMAIGATIAGGGALYNSLRGKDPEMEKAKKATADAEKARIAAEKREAEARKAEADKAKKDAEKAKAKGKKLTPDQLDALRGTGKYAPPGVAPKVGSASPTQPKAPRNFDVLPDGSVISKKTGKPLTGAAKATALKFNAMDMAAGGKPNIDTTTPKVNPDKGDPRKGNSDSGARGKTKAQVEKIAKANKAKASKIIAKKVAGALIKAVPILGAAAGIWFAGMSLAKGDTTTAALEGGSIFLPSLSGVPVDIMAVATSTFFDLYGVPYNQANPEHRILMKDIGEMVAEEFERQKKDEKASEKIAYEEGGTDVRVAMNAKAEQEQMAGYLGPGAVSVNGVTQSTAVNNKNSATGKMLQSNADFFKTVGEGKYAKGSRANIAAAEKAAAAAAAQASGASGGGTVNNVTNIQGGSSVVNKNDQVIQQFGVAGLGDGTDPYGLPGAVSGGGGGR